MASSAPVTQPLESWRAGLRLSAVTDLNQNPHGPWRDPPEDVLDVVGHHLVRPWWARLIKPPLQISPKGQLLSPFRKTTCARVAPTVKNALINPNSVSTLYRADAVCMELPMAR